MATIKSFTDFSQAKVLAEILPLESADMVYFGIHQGMDGKYYLSGNNTEDDVVPIYKNLCTKVFVKTTTSDIICQLPCWSLVALLSVLPYPQLSKDKLGSGKEGWMVSVYPKDCRYDSCWHDNPVDACYEMVCWLLENEEI